MVDALKRLLMAIAAIAAIAFLLWRCVSLRVELSEMRDRHEANVTALTEEVRVTKLHDSLAVARAGVLELRADEAERCAAGLRRQVSELRLRLKDVRSAVSVETVTRDTVYFPEIVDAAAKDTCLTYSDDWATFRLCADGGARVVEYAVRDSVTAYIHVHYRKRFLWWRWRPEYRATVVSGNPRATVTAMEAVVLTE